MIRHLVFLALFASAGAHAQDATYGERPPTAPANRATTVGVPGLAPIQADPALIPQQAQNTRVAANAAVQSNAPQIAAPQDGPEPAPAPPAPRRAPRPNGPVPAAPPMVDLRSGINATMGIAFSHTNRLMTPFAHPQVKTNSTASISVEGPIVYVSTNLDEPISLFIHEKDKGDPAISLTLIPQEIPATSTTVRLIGYEGASFGGGGEESRPASTEMARTFESNNPYVETLVTMMKQLALQKVPDGYGLETLRGYHRDMPVCAMPGLRIEPMQLLTGSELTVFVARATNVTNYPVEVREDACDARARAVAAWPVRYVQPGKAVELYVVSSKEEQPDTSTLRRSVIGSN